MAAINQDLTFDILIPTYNGAECILETIQSILTQSYKNFSIIICDDCSKDDTIKVIHTIKDKRIKIYPGKKNVGYPQNLEKCRQHATADIIFLMGQDDILGKDALLKTYQAFKLSDNIGAVTRPYFWFDKDINIPVRAKKQLNPKKDAIVKITDNPQKVIRVFETLDQLSGLAYRRKFMNLPFHPDIFPCHIYPFAEIFTNHPIVFLRDYDIAVRIASSQTRKLSSIYNKSPILSWYQMFDNIFVDSKLKKIKRICIKEFVAKNYVGLVQIKNYSYFKYLIREIFYLVKFRWQNLFCLQFWFFSLGTVIMPPQLLIPMVDWYKNKVNSLNFKNIKFEYQL
jgi:glycosyltransferase involved in cell wall biosynthesis